MRNAIICRFASILLCSLLAAPPRTVRAAQPQPESPTELNLVIVEGEGAVNNLRQRVVREPIVRVEDQNHKPVAGALVSFLLPGNGAGGTFADGAKLLTVTTDANGQAVARGIKSNNVSGQYKIQITASLGKLTATAAINESNAAAAAAAGMATSTKLIIILAIAGAVAGGVAYGVTRGGGSSGNSATALSPGGATVVAPH
ncbi:MAG: hypothetical protein ACLP59_04720 [Bryobacteraceae bacterium]